MRSVLITELTGPEHLVVAETPDPTPAAGDVLIDVYRVGVAFPDLLLSRGQYQVKPELPFSPGADLSGVVVSGPVGLAPGTRVAAVGSHGGAAERVAVPARNVFPLPDSLSFDEGAAMPMNYLTAHFVLRERAALRAGETVLVLGAAGGVGTAAIQVAKGFGARVIAVTSTPEKGRLATTCGADDVAPLDGFKDAALELTGGRGVDIVVDPVGGEVFTDSLRMLAPQGRLMVVGFAAGQVIPEVKVNRLLLNNIDVRGAAWGAFAARHPEFPQRQWRELLSLVESGVVKPPIGGVYEFDQFGRALVEMDRRRTLGKMVVRVRD